MAVIPSSVALASVRIARFSDETFKKRETAAEADYMARQERDALRAILRNLDKQADPKGRMSTAALEVICEKHGVKTTPAMEADLRAWKNDGCFTPQYVD